MKPAPLFRIARLAVHVGFLVPLLAAREANAGAVIRSASGPGPTIPAPVQTAVDQFRNDLGSLNANVAGSFMIGRREVNWDGVPDTSAAPNNLPADFFNITSPGGVVFSTAGTGFRVSADSSNPTSTPHQFGDIDPGYPSFFEPFSAQRLFTPIGSNVMDVTFFVPGTSIPASVSGFGVVFSDVDTVNATSIQFFDIAGNSLGVFSAPNAAGTQTFSFVGVSFNAGERAARVRITCGTQVLAAGNTVDDLVVMDDFIYSEPVAYPDVIIVDSAANMLFRFHSRAAGTLLGGYPVTGLVAGERLVAIDFRPASGELFGLIHNGGNSGRLITVPFTGGAVTQVGNTFPISGSTFGFDFNPTIDRIRITSDADQNFSVDPTNAVVTVQTPLNPGNPTVAGSAYTNNFPGATTTQLFGIEFGVDTLVSQSPPASGTLTTLGSLGVDTSSEVGFDIQGYTNSGYATLTLAGTSRLFTVDLDDGSARDLGVIGLGGIAGGMALVPQAPTTITPLNTPLLAVDAGNNLLLFNSDSPGSVTVRPITGLLSNEAIHGIDVRPATQTVYALGILNGPGANDSAGRLYTIDPNSGAATPVASGNPPFYSSLTDNASYGFDFIPATDRIRVVNSADQNLRLNPNSGVLVQFDTPLANAATSESVSAVAYDRNDLDPATATTLYAINAATNTLEIVGGINGPSTQSANTGVLNVVGPLGSTMVSAVSGFDISPTGHAFAALTVTGGFCNLYSVDLANGTAISRGLIAVVGSAIRGLTVAPQPCAITCPSPIAVNTAPNQCAAVVNYPPPTSTGVCGPVVTSPASGTTFQKGITTVTATAQSGASCTFTVTVNDTQAPSFTCPADITQQADPGQNGAVVTYGPSTVADNCPSPGTPQFTPPSGTFFPVGTGTVSAQVGDASGNFTVCSFSVTITAPPPAPTPTPTPTPPVGLVGNVSTRLPVGTDDNVLIEGFIVQGPVGSTKKIMVRALGPFLTQFGVTDALPNPTLEIRDGTNTVVATNNDWRNTQVGGIITSDQAAEIEGSLLAPTNDHESAIIANLTPGNYTAVVRGVNNTVGTGIVDAYDMSPASPARLANVATRGLIQPGDQLMIAGFIIQQGDVRAVVRAIGPSLSAFGINNALPDTTLQLRDVNGAIVRENDDWEIDQKGELEATGLQPGNTLEAAIVTTLPPGQYTAQIRGKPEATGIGVVEIYFLQ